MGDNTGCTIVLARSAVMNSKDYLDKDYAKSV